MLQGIAVAELVQRHIAGFVQHRLTLDVRQIREALVERLFRLVRDPEVVDLARTESQGGTALGAVVVPVDVAVDVVQPLHQHLAELRVSRGLGVVVAGLRQRHVHRRVGAAHLHALRAHLLGDLRLDPGVLRHLHLPHGHRGLTHHHIHGLGHRDQALDADRARRGDGGLRIQHHRSTGLQAHRAAGADQPVAADRQGAAAKLRGQDRALQLGARPAQVHPGIHVDAVVGGDDATHRQRGTGIEQHAPRRGITAQGDADAGRAGAGGDLDLVGLGAVHHGGIGRVCIDLRRQRGHQLFERLRQRCAQRLGEGAHRLAGHRPMGDAHGVGLAAGQRKALHVDDAVGVHIRRVGRIHGHEPGFHLAHDADGGRSQVHQFVGLDDGLCLGRQRAGDDQRVSGAHVDLGVRSGGIHVAARQHVDVLAGDAHLVTNIDVAQHRDVAACGIDLQQADLGRTQVALADDAFDLDAIGGRQPDAAAGGGVQGAARTVVILRVQHQRADQQAHLGTVHATLHHQAVIGGDQAIDHHLAQRRHGDVGAGVEGRDFAVHADSAVSAHADAGVSTGCGFAPDRRLRGSELPCGRGDDRGFRAEEHAHARAACAGLDGDGAGGLDAAPDPLFSVSSRVITQADGARGVEVHGCQLARPGTGSRLRGRRTGRRRGVGGAGVYAAQHDDVVAAQRNPAVVAAGIELGIALHGDQPASTHVERGASTHLGAFVCQRAAEGQSVADLEGQALAGALRQQLRALDRDVVPGLDEQRSGQRERTVQLDVIDRLDGDLVVEDRGRRKQTDHVAEDIDIRALQQHGRAGLKPPGFTGNLQRALGGLDLQQTELRVALAHGAVDQHVVQAGQEDAAARVQRRELAGAVGAQALLARLHSGAGTDDDVALRSEVAPEFQGVARLDDDVRTRAARHQRALQHRCARGSQHHAARQGLQQAGGFQLDRLSTAGRTAAVQIDGAVGADPARDRDVTAGLVELADVHCRPEARCVDGVPAARGHRAAGGPAGGDLRQAQALRTAPGHRRNRELEAAREHQPAVIEPDVELIGRVVGA